MAVNIAIFSFILVYYKSTK